MKKITLTFLLCLLSVVAMATSTPSGDKEKSSRSEVTPGMAAPSAATLQGVLTDEMLSAEQQVQESMASEGSRELAEGATSTARNKTVITNSERVVHYKDVKKESRFLKRVKKVRNRILRKNDEGSFALGLIALLSGIFSFIFLVLAPFGAIFGSGLGWVFLILAGVLGLAAIVCGALGLGGENAAGKGLGVAGLVIGIVSTAIFLIAGMIAVLIASL